MCSLQLACSWLAAGLHLAIPSMGVAEEFLWSTWSRPHTLGSHVLPVTVRLGWTEALGDVELPAVQLVMRAPPVTCVGRGAELPGGRFTCFGSTESRPDA